MSSELITLRHVNITLQINSINWLNLLLIVHSWLKVCCLYQVYLEDWIDIKYSLYGKVKGLSALNTNFKTKEYSFTLKINLTYWLKSWS